MEPLFRYRCNLIDVHDGDTVIVDIDLGCYAWLRGQRCRLHGINAPELATAAGKVARDALAALLKNKKIVAETIKDSREKYGRWLLRLHVREKEWWTCANDWMVANHYAVQYDGGTR